jgi:hypothetical protein
MINELIPLMGLYQAMLIAGYNEYQIKQIIKGSTHEPTAQE